jgi:hypothetical protein
VREELLLCWQIADQEQARHAGQEPLEARFAVALGQTHDVAPILEQQSKGVSQQSSRRTTGVELIARAGD